jgi:CRISPR system Cascade subunit CasD
MICCAMGKSRVEARQVLSRLNNLAMAVRIDRPGVLTRDYHTVGARIGCLDAKGGIKRTASTGEIETLVTSRYYLADASFLVALQGPSDIVDEAAAALMNPVWPVFLGRKSCPPSTPVISGEKEKSVDQYDDLLSALKSQAWSPRLRGEHPTQLDCFVEWRPSAGEPYAPAEAEVWQDSPFSFDPPVHNPRLVRRFVLRIPEDVNVGGTPQSSTPIAEPPRAKYKNNDYNKARAKRLEEKDHHLCVFCKAPAGTVQHITYRRAGGNETQEDLRSLCRLCHDAVTMIEYGIGMGLDRINPEEPRWRDRIIEKRKEIINFRSLATRRRHLQPEEVE